jgi:hypothetical protein
MSHLEPFRLREDMRKSENLFEVARACLGDPNQHSVVNSRRVLNWIVMDNHSQHTITVGHDDGSDLLEINWEQDYFSNDNTVFVNYSTFRSDWRERVIDFIEKIKKPWVEWAEEEFLENPMWIYLFLKANGSVSDSLHSAMTLSSYENPNNEYVKRYFQEWKRLRHPSKEG